MIKKLSTFFYSKAIQDQRVTFPDNKRRIHKPRSKVIQFYSSVHNIGNYMPILAGHEILDMVPDKWCLQAKNIDFDYINNNYKGVIIGGAGLLHSNFENFWSLLAKECKIPITIWGVGLCAPYNSDRFGVNSKIVNKLQGKLELVNFRDELTAHYYNLPNTNISFCPTIVYIVNNYKRKSGDQVLLAMHNELDDEKEVLFKYLKKNTEHVLTTNNQQSPWYGLTQMIAKLYCESKVIVTSKLHGAITAFSLGIPYIAFPVDKKLDEFVESHGNGLLVHDTDSIIDSIERTIKVDHENIKQEYNSTLEFGLKVKSWVNSL